MTAWEHKTTESNTRAEFMELANKLGEDGWELVKNETLGKSIREVIVGHFKRKKPE